MADALADIELSFEKVQAICLAMTGEESGVHTTATISSTGIEPQRLVAAEAIFREAESDEINFPSSMLLRLEAALRHGHVRIMGPPGVGKSTLAQAILRSVVGDNYVFALATSQWTSDDVIGGYAPDPEDSNRLVFRPGLVLEAAEADKWLCIDEINRADMDSAFGELFSLLANFDTDLPYLGPDGRTRVKIYATRPEGDLSPGEYGLPADWRMIATMNSWDKVSLNRMSFAFSRRWCTVYLPVPEPAEFATILAGFFTKWPAADTPGLRQAMRVLFVGEGEVASVRDAGLALGPGIAKSVIRDVAAMLDLGMTESAALAASLTGFVFPQFEGKLQLHGALDGAIQYALSCVSATDDETVEARRELEIFTGHVPGD